MQRITFRTPFYLHFQIGCLDAYALFLLFFPQTLTDVSPKSFMESFAGLKKNHWENTVMRANVGLKKDGRCHHLWFCDREGSGIRGTRSAACCSRGEVLPKPREISCHWRRRLKRCGGLKKGGKRANDSSVSAVHDVPGTPGKHLRALLQCGSRLRVIAEGRLCNWWLLSWNFLEFIRSK